MSERLFIMVEGNDDERFFKKIVVPLFSDIYDKITIWQHAQKSREAKENFLSSIKALKADYIYVEDMDEYRNIHTKINMIKNSMDKLQPENILIVIKEIEGWYLAGLDEDSSRKLNLTYLPETNDIFKEDFNKMIPKKFDSRIDFMQEILKKFSISKARIKNDSFNYFMETFAT